jgi:hypothetical protein
VFVLLAHGQARAKGSGRRGVRAWPSDVWAGENDLEEMRLNVRFFIGSIS